MLSLLVGDKQKGMKESESKNWDGENYLCGKRGVSLRQI